MAKSPALVQVTTSTTGFGPYTLTNTVPAATGYRSIADAVADGSLSNGDEVYYEIVNPTAAGTGKLFERGRGTLNTTTLVLTVVAVIERSTSLASGGGWGAGVKDVLIVTPGAESVAAVSSDNQFTAIQTFNAGVQAKHLSLATYSLIVNSLLRGRVNADGSTTQVDYLSSGGVLQGRLLVGNNTIQFSDGTTTKEVARLDSGMKVVQLAGGNVNKVPWYQAAAPTGWVKDTSQNDKAMRIVSGTGGGSGGSRALSSTVVGGTSLSVAHLAPHSHTLGLNITGPAAGANIGLMSGAVNSLDTRDTLSTGSGDPHDHDLSLAYIDIIIASLT